MVPESKEVGVCQDDTKDGEKKRKVEGKLSPSYGQRERGHGPPLMGHVLDGNRVRESSLLSREPLA